jgi:hypothetical protein
MKIDAMGTHSAPPITEFFAVSTRKGREIRLVAARK